MIPFYLGLGVLSVFNFYTQVFSTFSEKNKTLWKYNVDATDGDKSIRQQVRGGVASAVFGIMFGYFNYIWQFARHHAESLSIVLFLYALYQIIVFEKKPYSNKIN